MSAVDGGDSAAFSSIFLASSFFYSSEPHPALPPTPCPLPPAGTFGGDLRRGPSAGTFAGYFAGTSRVLRGSASRGTMSRSQTVRPRNIINGRRLFNEILAKSLGHNDHCLHNCISMHLLTIIINN